MKKAAFFHKIDRKKVQCVLCPHKCVLLPDQKGICQVRKNVKGDLFTENYERLCSVALDPIEKKPLYHYFPGKNILSIGSVGCNLKCKFCQNFEISQSNVDESPYLKSYTSEEVIQFARHEQNNVGVAYTYNEPIVFYEYVLETAKHAHENGLKNVFVSNGYINPEPLEKLIPFIDAFSIDLKGFTKAYYEEMCSGNLEDVKKAILQIKEAGKHIELTNLVVTDVNDQESDFYEMIKWIANSLGEETVLHISRYFPMFKFKNLPTSHSKLKILFKIAKQELDHVYIGNMRTDSEQNTYCPNCDSLLIKRSAYEVELMGMDQGSCIKCNTRVMNYA
ncbi:MAG: AmmeMemoRadiSam system radical SAM enzyme [Bacteroidetes bacterium]|nr:AmmeMemoRadiSam system radical SAM enzyme [Bacteroidota bacterium]